jgi:hypothetical protein
MTMRRHLLLTGVLLAVALTSCGGPRLKTFNFRAIDDRLDPVPCVFIENDEWPETLEDATIVDGDIGTDITIDFTKRNAAWVKLVPIDPADLDQDGNLVRVPQSSDQPLLRAKENPREVEFRDLPRVLFVFFSDR